MKKILLALLVVSCLFSVVHVSSLRNNTDVYDTTGEDSNLDGVVWL